MKKVKRRPVDVSIDVLMQDLYEPVNLDGFVHGPDGDSAELVALENVYGRLAAYIAHKRQAQKYRVAGDIEAAMSFERCVEEHYNQLPSWAQW